MQILKLKEVLKKSEDILSESLNGNVQIKSHKKLSKELVTEIKSIDSKKFRKDLQYDESDLSTRASLTGFYCLLVYLNDELIAFDYGYEDSEDGVFFSDSAATLIERKGIARLLGLLELLYVFESGYKKIKFTTEEMDELGRPLREIWEKQGYKTEKTYPDGNVDMVLEINPSIVAERIKMNLR